MKAAVFTGLGKPLEVQELPDPMPQPGQVVIDVHRCGICGSDLHMSEDPGFGLPHGSVMGHEFAGEVIERASGTERIKVGDLVSVVPLRGCGHCRACLSGEPAWCSQFMLQAGGYGEFAVASERQCVVMPQGLSMADGAIIEPLAVALHGAMLAAVRPGGQVVIVGAGPIGLSVAFWARRLGASKVVVVDIADFQEGRALSMGATHFVSGATDPVAEVERILGGKADVAFECVGVPGLIAQCIDHVGIKGSVVLLGLCTKPDSFVPFSAVQKEVKIQSSAFFTEQEYRMSLDVLSAGAFEPRLLVTDTIPLSQVPATFEALKRRSGQSKVLINHD